MWADDDEGRMGFKGDINVKDTDTEGQRYGHRRSHEQTMKVKSDK